MPTNTITLTRPDDWHIHLRDGEAMQAIVGHTAKQFARAVIMPNLKPPVTTVALAQAYRGRIEAALDACGIPRASFTPLMTLYLTDRTAPDEIARQPKCKVMAHFAEADHYIPMDGVHAFAAARREVTVHTYAADHGFNCDQRASHNEAAATLARGRTLAFFAEHLS